MNKLLVVIFDGEAAANAGLGALRSLHDAGDITLYAAGVLVKDAQGQVSVRKSIDVAPVGTVTGLAVGSLIGLLGGPIGLAVGALTGSMVGAVRDFWVAGVGLDFIEDARTQLAPGKVALVAEVEEEWITPVDVALAAAGGHVLRRTRGDLGEWQFDHDIAAFRSEVADLESEASHAGAAAKASLQTKLDAAKSGLDGAVHRARQRVDTLKQEADAKAESLGLQLGKAKGDAKARVEDRIGKVKAGYHMRSAKLSQAWSLTKQALGA